MSASIDAQSALRCLPRSPSAPIRWSTASARGVSHNPQSYVLWLLIGTALLLVPYALYRDGRDVIPAMQRFWLRGLAGGALQTVAYGTALWAMTLAPIAIVATLRETSVLFSAVIAVVVLKEPLRAVRIGAALLILAGLVLIRLQ